MAKLCLLFWISLFCVSRAVRTKTKHLYIGEPIHLNWTHDESLQPTKIAFYSDRHGTNNTLGVWTLKDGFTADPFFLTNLEFQKSNGNIRLILVNPITNDYDATYVCEVSYVSGHDTQRRIQIKLIVFCECCASEKIEKQNRDIELVFDVGNGGGFISYENDQSRALVFGLVNMTKLVYVDNMRIIKRTKNEVTLKISNLQMRNAGKYYVKLFEKYESEYCGVNLIVTKKPNVKIKYLDVHVDGVTFKCNTFSASRPSNHNLTMVYRWFVGDSLQQVSSADLHVANTEQIHTDKLNLSCVASDHPHCSSLLNLTHDIKLDDIIEDGRCAEVLGVAITPILNYSNLTLINTTSPNAVIGQTVQIIWILFAFPEINVDRKSYQTPSGIGTQFLDVTLSSTNTPLHYKLLLTLPVISQYDIGRYCVSVYNQMRRLTVCHTLTRDWTLVIGVSASGAVLLLVILAVFVSFIRRRNRSNNQTTDQNDDISLHEQRESYETVPDRVDEDINTSVQVHATRHSSDPSSASTPSFCITSHTVDFKSQYYSFRKST